MKHNNQLTLRARMILNMERERNNAEVMLARELREQFPDLSTSESLRHAAVIIRREEQFIQV